MYETPTPEQLKAFMQKNSLTGVDIAALTGVNARTVRRWVAPAGQKGAAPIPWAAWAMLQLLTGNIKKGELLKIVNQWKERKLGLKLFERGKAGRPPNYPKEG
ncbi:MAG: hypothetical protein LBP76_04020 [Treponema sp.]|jgi:hypothetical protein|nr:hypothetical protein [Treponema sp.]